MNNQILHIGGNFYLTVNKTSKIGYRPVAYLVSRKHCRYRNPNYSENCKSRKMWCTIKYV